MSVVYIPDLDDEAEVDLPFVGRPFGQTGSFNSHGRDGSGASEPAGGFQFPNSRPSQTTTPVSRPSKQSVSSTSSYGGTGFNSAANASQTSLGSASGLATSSGSGFSFPARKTSFASLKNAFKTGAGHHAVPPPPVPAIDPTFQAGLPNLRNPFSRAESPSSPGYKSKGFPKPHDRKQSAYSHRSGTSSGSNKGRNDEPLPALPSIPRKRGDLRDRSMSNFSDGTSGFGGSTSEALDPITPSDYALQVLLRRFVQMADSKVGSIMSKPLTMYPSIVTFLGPGVDPEFDSVIVSLAGVARRSARKVTDAVMAWVRTQTEGVSRVEVRNHMTGAIGPSVLKIEDAASILAERKLLSAKYILSRILIEIVMTVPKDAIGDDLANSLEQHMFSAYRADHPDQLAQFSNKRANSVLYAEFLGKLSAFRFLSVSDRFIRELNKLAKQLPPPKDVDARVEHIVRGMADLQVRVYPEDDLDASADFLHDVARWFAHAHGSGVKLAYAEMLNKMLHPIVQSATAEVNHPIWSKAIAIIYQRAIVMCSKPRYWTVCFPLVITSLCVSPREIFMEQWQGHIDALVVKLKDRSTKAIAMNSVVRLLWVYLNRCSESSTSTAKRLGVLFRTFFPPGLPLYPSEIPMAPFISVMHFTLAKQLAYGKDQIFDFLREGTLGREVNLASKTDNSSPERMTIALRAVMVTLQSMESEQGGAWPTKADYSSFDQPVHAQSDIVLDSLLDKPGVTDFIKRLKTIAVNILYLCDRDVGHLVLFDERYSTTKVSYSSTDVTPEALTCKHGDVFVTYPRRYRPRIELLTAVLDAMPPCITEEMHRIIPIICHTTFLGDPAAAASATSALKRLAAIPAHCQLVVDSFRHFLLDSGTVFKDSSISTRLQSTQQERVVRLYIELLELFASHHRAALLDLFSEDQTFRPATVDTISLIEASGLFFLLSASVAIRKHAVDVLRTAAALAEPTQRRSSVGGARLSRFVPAVAAERTSQLLAWTEDNLVAVRASAALNSADRQRLDTWTKEPQDDWLLKVCQSENVKDGALWTTLLPFVVHQLFDSLPEVVGITRGTVVATLLRLHSSVSVSSGVSQNRHSQKPPTADMIGLADQWRAYITFLCASMQAEATQLQFPSRVDPQPTADRLATPRGLFTLILPYLTSDQSRFRDAVVYPLGCIRQPFLRPLLEQLQAITRHLFDDFRGRSKSRRPGDQSRLHTAVAQVFRLVSPMLQDRRSLGDTVILSSMINFVRETHLFLGDPEVRDDFELQRLRRYFCGVVEQLANGLSHLESSERFLPPDTRGAIFKMAYSWCTLGRRADVAKARESATLLAAADSYHGDRDKAQYLDMLQADTRLLSAAAADCMASLCQGPLLTDSAATPEQHASASVVEPLSVLSWIRGLLSSSLPSLHQIARKALSALIKYNTSCTRLLDEVLHQSYAEGEQFPIDRSFFGVGAISIMDGSFPLESSAIACFALSKLGHPLACIRERAFDLVENLLPAAQDRLILAPLHPAICSSAAIINVSAQRQISEHLALAYADQSAAFARECIKRASHLEAPRRSATLAVFPPWLANLDLMSSQHGDLILAGLMQMAARFAESLPQEMQSIWRSLTCGAYPGNAAALIKFLLEQGTRRRSLDFVVQARLIVGSLAESNIGPAIFEEVCSLIEPAAMVPRQDPRASQSELDALFAAPSKPVAFSTGQLAIQFAGQLLTERAADAALGPPVAVLLHAIMTQVDHPVAMLRDASRAMLIQALRAWICDVALDEETAVRWLESRQQIASLASTVENFWESADYGTVDSHYHAPKAMAAIIDQILNILSPYHPSLRQEWGELALEWGTSCPVRHLACRSFQFFRILMPRISPSMLADMLGRLSNTIADDSSEIQAFSREIIHTLSSIVQITSAEDINAVPQVFWCTAACLSTTVEEEYIEVVDLMANLLDKVDLGDPEVARQIANHQPPDWASPDLRLQSLLSRGLRSSKTDEASFDVIRRLAGIADDVLIDSPGDRLVNGLVAALPWLLRSLDDGAPSEEMALLAMDLARMADESDRASVSRLLLSFAKHRFRTKDDFIRQLAASLRDTLVSHATHVVFSLVGLVLNGHEWIRDKSLQVLSLVLQAPEARDLLADNAELLMPLLRLLQTPQAAKALEILELPSSASVGARRGSVSEAPPNFSGWSPGADDAELTRRNVFAVYNTFTLATRAASTHLSTVLRFEDVPELATIDNPNQVSLAANNASMGDLVGALHSLNQFFDDGEVEPKPQQYHVAQESASDQKVRATLTRNYNRHERMGSDVYDVSDNEGSITQQFNFPAVHQSQASMSSLGIGSDSDFADRHTESAFGLDEEGSDETDGGMPALPVSLPPRDRLERLLPANFTPSPRSYR